ncbi:efflux RND transporter periplasmic adaptor subunit [Oscillatoria sp. CS-180]|uniref:efflux RND transporter periplasmic adaptor subunit n=1 Tax=Oscillatoria sp. CS-180 TaxID=3021720 RepID=UPI00232B7A94|nr:efflux RND transporter periplasmic adaptor subunit [Oscillatoria sp. CS-180]MDB9528971.1 efflux RND transporter periplasmic adaptor subunit [Oscillatoria sp. CS-180]
MTQLQDSDSVTVVENESSLAKEVSSAPRGYGKLFIGVGLGIAIAVLGSRFFAGGSAPIEDTPVAETTSQVSAQTVTVIPVQTGQVTERLTITGTVQPADLLQVTPQIGGLQIRDVLVDEGDRVVAGQPLVILNDTELRTQIEQAQSQIEVAQAQLQQERANLSQSQALLAEAEANEQSYRSLADQGAISREELRSRSTQAATARESVRVAEANVASAEATIRSRQSELARLENQLQYTTVVAPMDGIVAERPASVGNVSSTASAVVTLIEGNQLELMGDVPQAQLTQVQIGAPAVVTSSTDPSIRVEGTIREVQPLIDPQTRTAKVIIGLPESDRLRAGMFLTANIQVGQRSGLVIPATALLPQTDGSIQVYVLGEGQTAVARSVEVGTRISGTGDTPDQVEIVQGLRAGDQVIVAGASYVQEGDVVTVAE